jgi:transposase
MEPSRQLRYSVAFKRQVVAELESGRFASIEQARVHYGIGGNTTIRRWLERMGRNDLMAKVVRVEKPGEANQIAELKKQVRQLQQALGQTQLRNVLNETLLEMACQQLGVDVETFKKKADAMRSPGPTSKAGTR